MKNAFGNVLSKYEYPDISEVKNIGVDNNEISIPITAVETSVIGALYFEIEIIVDSVVKIKTVACLNVLDTLDPDEQGDVHADILLSSLLVNHTTTSIQYVSLNVLIKDHVATYSDLPATADVGDAYVVDSDGLLYVYGTNGFPASGQGMPFKGDKGDKGNDGQLAVYIVTRLPMQVGDAYVYSKGGVRTTKTVVAADITTQGYPKEVCNIVVTNTLPQ
ncbi:MAG: hypothetical protein LBM67_08460 [Lentimicrobiaceae bacterium]|nr:hypothetical protein [Lentimicrobiaceae bacterium]